MIIPGIVRYRKHSILWSKCMIRFGIIGMGIRGKLFASTIKQSAYAEVAAVCDISEENAANARKSYNVNSYTDYHLMLDKEKLDAVIIATPDFLHRDAVTAAADKVKNIMIEKPLSTSVAECSLMCSVLKKNNVKCLIAFENRWSLPFISVKDRIDSGTTGEVLHINAKLNNTLFVPAKMLPWAKDSTPAWFLFPHLVDMACWLSGKTVEKVYASGFKKKLVSMGIDTYDSISSLMTFSDGTTAQLSSSWILPETMPVVADQKMDLICANEAVSIDLMPQMISIAGSAYNYPRVLSTQINGKLNGPPSLMLHSFIDNIRNNTAPLANEDDGMMNTRIIDAVHESLVSGNPVHI